MFRGHEGRSILGLCRKEVGLPKASRSCGLQLDSPEELQVIGKVLSQRDLAVAVISFWPRVSVPRA